MPTDFNQVFDTLKSEVVELAKTTVAEYADQAVKDGVNLLNEMKGDLETWTIQLTAGEMNEGDFKFLLGGQKDVLELVSLKQVGIAKAKLDAFKNAIFDLILNTVSAIV